MMATTPDDQALHDLVPLAAHLGIESFATESDVISAKITWNSNLCTTGGVLHGGVIMALADTCGAACAFANLPKDAIGTATIESKSNFFRAVRDGHIKAHSRALHVGRTTIVVETDVFDEKEHHVARVIQTQAVLS